MQRSLNVTAKDAAKILLSEYQLREAKYRHSSKLLIVKKPIGALFEEYIKFRPGRERTKEWYRWCEKYFTAYCEVNGIENVSDVGMEVIEAFYTARKAEAPGGARSHLRALRAIFAYAVKKGYLRENPTMHVKADKPPKKMFKDLSFDEIGKLLDTAKARRPALYPLYAMAYYAGLRANEARYLEPCDINFKERYIHVRSKPENLIKDHQERRIPLHGTLLKILGHIKAKGRWLIATKDGKARQHNLNRELKNIGKFAGIDTKGLSLQVLRETFGSHLRRRGVDIALISQYMGHSSIDVTLRHYAHIPLEETHKEIDLL